MAKVTMPQLGESVAEGTIGKWLKQPGDTVAKYEPLLEVITDKVNAEVPSPFAGVLKEILAEEGATVPNNAEIAVIETEEEAGGASCRASGGGEAAGRPPPAESTVAPRRSRHRPRAAAAGAGSNGTAAPAPAAQPEPERPERVAAAAAPAAPRSYLSRPPCASTMKRFGSHGGSPWSVSDGRRRLRLGSSYCLTSPRRDATSRGMTGSWRRPIRPVARNSGRGCEGLLNGLARFLAFCSCHLRMARVVGAAQSVANGFATLDRASRQRERCRFANHHRLDLRIPRAPCVSAPCWPDLEAYYAGGA